jgi:hypothetical protein
MQLHAADLRSLAFCVVLGALTPLSGCGSKEPPAQQAQAPAAPADSVPIAAQPAPAPVDASQVNQTWTPEALEELLAPIALYPDPVLSQMLIASTNPQEVLDAGNWLLQNTELKGKALDDAAATVGFTPPIRALVQFPETVDMMCLELGWTTELGEAFVADQAGVLDAVQRLRKQAMDVGNLQSTEQMKVETTQQEGQDVVVLKPAKPEVVYVPQYDPVAAYAPLPPTTAATTTVTEQKSGHSTGAMITTGVLAFGAGILINELFDDDDDDRYGYYYPNYGYGGMPYYPPYPYRPSYGGGYYPSHGYNRPPNYNSGFQNTGNIVINTRWWRRLLGPVRQQAERPAPDHHQQPDHRRSPEPAGDQRPEQAAAAADAGRREAAVAGRDRRQLEGPGRLCGRDARQVEGRQGPHCKCAARLLQARADAARRPARRPRPRRRCRAAMPAPSLIARSRRQPASQPRRRATCRSRCRRPATCRSPSRRRATYRSRSKVQGDRGYARPMPDKKPAARPQTMERPAASKPMPTTRPAPAGGNRGTAMSSAQNGNRDRAASQRGKQSLPQGARSKGGGGGGKKQQR